MKNKSIAANLGQTLGKTVRGVLRVESLVWDTLAAAHIPRPVVSFLKWALRIAALAIFAVTSVYLLAIILALLALVSLRSIGLIDDSDSDISDTQPGWRMGDSGYGHYDAMGIRDDQYGR